MRTHTIKNILERARAILMPKRAPFSARIITAYAANLRGQPAEFSPEDSIRGMDMIDGRQWEELRAMEREIEACEDNTQKIKE